MLFGDLIILPWLISNRNMLIASTYVINLAVIDMSNTSLMSMINNRGRRMLPWGTSEGLYSKFEAFVSPRVIGLIARKHC